MIKNSIPNILASTHTAYGKCKENINNKDKEHYTYASTDSWRQEFYVKENINDKKET